MTIARAATLVLVLAIVASGCRCGSKPVPAPAPAPTAVQSGCRDGTVGEVLDVVRTVEVDGTEREYILDVPAGDADRRLPVVFLFHGIGGTPGPLRDITRMGEEAHARGFVAVHPKGKSVWLKGRVGPGWQIQAEDNRDVRLVEAVIDQLDSLYCIDRQRVFASGFSNGAHLAHVLACQLPERIAAIGAVGGGLREMAKGCGPVEPVPAVIVHGDADSIVGIEEGRAAHAFWVERNGCTGEQEKGELCVQHTGCASDPGVLYCEIPGYGHSWPLKEMGDPLDATTLVLDFFLGPEDAPPGPTIHFRAKVKSIDLLSESTATVIPAHFDARWAMTLKILSVEEEDAPLDKGGSITFGIHSPTKLFVGDVRKAVGGTYDFVIDAVQTDGGEWHWSVLRLAKFE